jgi:two-component system phosphate regulon sensor histidine kinase PhoR
VRRRWDFVFAGAVICLSMVAGFAIGALDARSALLMAALASGALAGWYAFTGRSSMMLALAAEQAEQSRRLNRYAVLLDSLPQPVMLLDREDRIELANAAACRIFGEEMEGEPFAKIIRAPNALSVVREARHSGAASEAEFNLTSPTELSALCHASPIDAEEDVADGEIIVMIRDRTEQRKLERMRTDFIANASHELRTPLASILGFIETLQNHAKDDAEARTRFLKIMQAQTERMLRLVKDLVSLSALELNERRLPQEEVDLCEVAAVTREIMTPVAAKAGGVILPAEGACSCHITGDRDQLIQVLQNLCDNALKYGAEAEGETAISIEVGKGPSHAFVNSNWTGDTPEQIAVRSDCAPQELLWFRVRDNGPGIDQQDLPRLTERFYRIDVERSRTVGGTGLGLAIVKHIVTRHRGGIMIESLPGKGAAFTCYFPPFGALDLDMLDAPL